MPSTFKAKVTRFSDWPTRLDHALAANRSRRFEHGSFDCCLAVAELVLAMTGTDIAAEYRGRYRTRKEALALIRERSGGTKGLRRFLEQALGHLPTVPVACAQRGDMVLVKRPGDVSLGIVSLNGKDILAVARQGFCRFPLRMALAAWRV